MADDMTTRLEAMLERDAGNPTLHFALAQRYFDAGRVEDAAEQAALAVDLSPDYSAAWRLLGRAQVAAGRREDAISSFERGIEVAERRGDKQAEKEMRVFLKRARAGE
jgi:tetratricopeptide (TPR) repeat protein